MPAAWGTAQPAPVGPALPLRYAHRPPCKRTVDTVPSAPIERSAPWPDC